MEGIISSLVRFEIRHFKKKDEIFPPFLWHSKFEWYLCVSFNANETDI